MVAGCVDDFGMEPVQLPSAVVDENSPYMPNQSGTEAECKKIPLFHFYLLHFC